MLAPLLIESHAFVIQQDRLRDAERFRRAHELSAGRTARVTFASSLRALATSLALVAFALGVFAIQPFQAHAEVGDISDLRLGVKDFMARAEFVYRLDRDSLQQIWIAYCGETDTNTPGEIDAARDKARELQDKEYRYWAPLLDEVSYWMQMATKIQESSSNASSPEKDEANKIYYNLRDQRDILRSLKDNVPLSGSNHPFVQYATDYGKQAHAYMCTQFGDDSTRVCDKSGWPGLGDRRPDLVAVSGGHLIVYEFKPNNDREISKGWGQLSDYLPAVVNYYQTYFPNGPTGATNGKVPTFGGQAMLDALANSPDTWDGNYLTAIPILQTYNMCDKKF